MPRRYRRRTYIRRPLKTIKYSNETACFNNFPVGAASGEFHTFDPFVLIPPTDIQGTRKVKNITLRIGASTTTVTNFIFAVVYVPDGTVPNGLSTSEDENFGSLYEPNQNVIMSGMFAGQLAVPSETLSDSAVSPSTFRSRLARNLNSGDSIVMLIASPTGWPGYQPPDPPAVVTPPVIFTILANFAISY